MEKVPDSDTSSKAPMSRAWTGIVGASIAASSAAPRGASKAKSAATTVNGADYATDTTGEATAAAGSTTRFWMRCNSSQYSSFSVSSRQSSHPPEHLADAVNKGAKLETGSQPGKYDGYFFQPTIIFGATADMMLCKDETFGPLAPVFEFATEDETLKLVNETGSAWRTISSVRISLVLCVSPSASAFTVMGHPTAPPSDSTYAQTCIQTLEVSVPQAFVSTVLESNFYSCKYGE